MTDSGSSRPTESDAPHVESGARTVEVFAGAVRSTVAYLYTRYSGAAGGNDIRLSGSVTGPHSETSRTLTARVSLNDLGAGESVLAQAILPDPCLWTPELPVWYRVDVELHQGASLIGRDSTMLGLRGLGCQRRNLWRANRRIVLRGISAWSGELERAMGWETWMLAAAITNPTPNQCERASRAGVFLVAHVTGPAAATEQLARLAKWPAVGMVTFDAGQLDQLVVEKTIDRPLVAQRMRDTQPDSLSPLALSPLADLVWLNSSAKPATVDFVRHTSLPVVVHQSADVSDLRQARLGCEDLQRQLSPDIDLSGYFIGPSGPVYGA